MQIFNVYGYLKDGYYIVIIAFLSLWVILNFFILEQKENLKEQSLSLLMMYEWWIHFSVSNVVQVACKVNTISKSKLLRKKIKFELSLMLNSTANIFHKQTVTQKPFRMHLSNMLNFFVLWAIQFFNSSKP